MRSETHRKLKHEANNICPHSDWSQWHSNSVAVCLWVNKGNPTKQCNIKIEKIKIHERKLTSWYFNFSSFINSIFSISTFYVAWQIVLSFNELFIGLIKYFYSMWKMVLLLSSLQLKTIRWTNMKILKCLCLIFKVLTWLRIGIKLYPIYSWN